MDPADDAINLIHLADGPDTGGGHSVSVRILGRWQPGILTGHDFLDCEIAVKAESVNGTFSVTLLPEDLEDWEDTLATLESGRFAAWLTSGRTPSMKFQPDESGGLRVSVHDGPASGVTVTLPLFAPPSTWVVEQRDLLTRARAAYPREVVETSPGAYEWRRARTP
ncbi:DUF5959 family protein [Streptomyces sp. NPDC093065]|uniref:DUF5959 family protein n=1 Tax=Streptomyces sp. NPDC093065 TaxID=3366021 RepID=UPI00380E3F95